MKIHLKNLAYIDKFDFLKIIISSADRFPGLYRFTSSWKHELHDSQYLKVLSFVEACFKTEINTKWTRDEWLDVHGKVYDLSFGEKGRNSERKDYNTGEMLRRMSIDWIGRAKSVSLAVIETNFPVTEILPDTTYYVMGSLIRFTRDHTYVSYNHFEGNWYAKLDIGFDDVFGYIRTTFSPDSLSELFFKAEIIGKLIFSDQGEANLDFNRDQLNDLLGSFTPNAPIFGTIDYPEILPIRLAKLVGVSNVCR